MWIEALNLWYSFCVSFALQFLLKVVQVMMVWFVCVCFLIQIGIKPGTGKEIISKQASGLVDSDPVLLPLLLSCAKQYFFL